MTGSDWKHPHIVVLVAAIAVAFGGGYWVGASGDRPAAAVPPLVINNELTTAPAPRARPDENTLVAENAEREETLNRARPAPAERVEAAEPDPEPRPEPRPRPRDRDVDRDRIDRDDPDLIDPGTVGEKPE